jgi:hypothetical protein
MQKSAKDVGVDKIDEKEKNKYNIVNPLTYWILLTAAGDINETKAKSCI